MPLPTARRIRRALAYCKAHPGCRLLIPHGIYHFYEAPDGVHMPLYGMEDLTVLGDQSQLIFHTPVAYWDILDSTRIHLKDLILDWAWEDAPLASVGVVSGIAPDGSYLDVTFPGCSQVPQDMEIRIVGPCDPHRYTPGCSAGMEFRPYRTEHVHLTDDANTDEQMQHLVHGVPPLPHRACPSDR